MSPTAPESWELATPKFGIRYPRPTAPAAKLPTAFEHIATDLDTALELGGKEPGGGGPFHVATSAAARDAFWGIPSTPADQRALQDRGASTVRTDLGYTERYFATYDAATNPGGRSTAGWYPVEGWIPYVEWTTQATIGDGAIAGVGQGTVTTNEPGLATPIIGGFRINRPGIYDVIWRQDPSVVAMTGRAFCRIFGGGFEVINHVPVGETQFGAQMTNLRITAASSVVNISVFQTSGAPLVVKGRALLTRRGEASAPPVTAKPAP